MTNFEKYYIEIKEIVFEGITFAKNDSGLKSCDYVHCVDCDFSYANNKNDKFRDCEARCLKWLCEEYIEPIRLTRKQRSFLEFLETGFIVRYESGILAWYAEKPMWDGIVWMNNMSVPRLIIDTKIVDFSFIEFGNKEPYSVEKMLTLEVEE